MTSYHVSKLVSIGFGKKYPSSNCSCYLGEFPVVYYHSSGFSWILQESVWWIQQEYDGDHPASLGLESAAAAAKSLQSCPTLCDPIDGSPPGSPVPGILQARTLEWVAISFSYAWKLKGKSLSHVWLFVTPWTAAHQAPPSMGFSRQEPWSGVPSPSP